jgi:hypothetical protein
VTECGTINIITNPETKKVSVFAEVKVNSNIYKINEEL